METRVHYRVRPKAASILGSAVSLSIDIGLTSSSKAEMELGWEEVSMFENEPGVFGCVMNELRLKTLRTGGMGSVILTRAKQGKNRRACLV